MGEQVLQQVDPIQRLRTGAFGGLHLHPVFDVGEAGPAGGALNVTRAKLSVGAHKVSAQVTMIPCAVRIRTTEVSSLSMALAR